MINKIFSFLFTGSRVSFFRKKTLIVNFKKDLTKTIKVIDLTKYQNYHFEVEKEEEVDKYKNNHKLILVDDTNVTDKVVLAYFESLEDGKKAMLDLNNKIYDRFLTTIYGLFKFAIIAFILLFIVDTVMLKIRTHSQNNTNSNVTQVDPAVLQQLRMQQSQQPVSQPIEQETQSLPIVNEPGSSGAKSILDSLQ